MGLPETRIREIIESRRRSDQSPHREAYMASVEEGWVLVYDKDDTPQIALDATPLPKDLRGA